MAFSVRGTTLPDRADQMFAVDGERLRVDPASDAEQPTGVFDEDRMPPHRDAGVLAHPERIILRGRVIK